MTWIPLSSKYNGTCRECKDSIEIGDNIYWNSTTKKVLHEACYYALFSSTRNQLEKIREKTKHTRTFTVEEIRKTIQEKADRLYDWNDKTPSNPNNYRHGDLLIREVTEFPNSLKKLNTKVLADGEATGHTHTIEGNAQIFENLNEDLDNKFLEVFDEVKLVHQEHKQINIRPGKYVVIIEREYNPFEEDEQEVLD